MDRLQKQCGLASATVHLGLGLILIFGPAFKKAPEIKRSLSINLLSASTIEATLKKKKMPEALPEHSDKVKSDLYDESEIEVQPKQKQRSESSSSESSSSESSSSESSSSSSESESRLELEVVKSKKEKDLPKPVEIKIHFNPTQMNFEKGDHDKDQRKIEIEQSDQDQKQWDENRELKRQKRIETLSKNLSERSEMSTGFVGNDLGNYRLFVKKSYDEAWIKPSKKGQSASVRVEVIVHIDGNIASAKIVTASENVSLNESVEDVINRIKSINRRPPNETTIAERTFIINFNLREGLAR